LFFKNIYLKNEFNGCEVVVVIVVIDILVVMFFIGIFDVVADSFVEVFMFFVVKLIVDFERNMK
jgi:hypothetical protein